jgi:hypothetical protein
LDENYASVFLYAFGAGTKSIGYPRRKCGYEWSLLQSVRIVASIAGDGNPGPGFFLSRDWAPTNPAAFRIRGGAFLWMPRC